MLATFITCVAVLVYAYAGYPLLLWVIVRLRGARPIQRAEIEPRVTLIISAFNEAAVIRQKLENTLALEYPKDRLEIIVVSDASSDATDEIVREYAGRGVTLARQDERRGKTAGLNHTVPQATGEIIVFSDANAMYMYDALQKLVRNFADPRVGCVTGEARYVESIRTAADVGERAYWNYEIQIKRLETGVGSMVGGDGAIYAIRRECWQRLPDDSINDFLNPLQIVGSGWRAVYEPEAVCYEETAGRIRTEYRRRIRIVSRSWRAVFQAASVLNPLRVGFFAVSLVSHKILRWMTGPLVLAAAISLLLVVANASPLARQSLLIAGALFGLAALVFPRARRLAQFGFYFGVLAMASIVGLLKGTFGHVSPTWSTPRASDASAAGTFAPWLVIVLAGLVLMAGVTTLGVMFGRGAALRTLFGVSIGVLVYVYLVYPALIAWAGTRTRRAVNKAPCEPTVCLFITANDEEAVIGAKLRNALELDYPKDRLDILVASDGSIDRTNQIVKSFEASGVRLLAYPVRRGKIAAINEGMATVTAEVVIFSDANTFLEPAAIRALVRNLADESIGAVSGDVMLEGERAALGTSEDIYYRYERWLQGCESRVGSMVGVDGALYAIRRELFVPPPVDTILDDMAIPMAVARAGRRVVFEREARAHERGSETATEEFVRKSRVVAGAVQFLRRPDSAVPRNNRQLIVTLVSHKTLRWLSPVFALLAFGTSVILALSSPSFLVLAVLQGIFMLAGLAGCWPRLRRVSPISFAHYFWLVQAAAAVGFARGLLGTQPVAWRRFQRPGLEVG